MVERPIKKSERQLQENADNGSRNMDPQPPVEPNPKRSKRNDNRSSAKGKKGAFENESKPPINPALARGPKPVKTPPKATVEPETEVEPVSFEPEGETAGETAEG
ncbi:MAG: hypothetical protein SAK29_30720 [Scytonema sp. PMC 1069.18]|nr:hypothetical protein [Scytonema sp. PMC 1069.18]MEC4887254.1 hypothetical protein [Scytonema sp. PMC 1070.18]